MTTTRTAIALLLLASLASAPGLATAAGKKLYCWTDNNGHKVCGDAVPPDAVERARTEISVKSGLQTGQVARALTAEERAAAAVVAGQAQSAAAAEAARQRRDLAMVESYGTEADLRRAYGERISLLDSTIKASVLGVSNLRLSLTGLLDQASDLELASKPVPPILLANVRNQHAELQKQQRILASQQQDRVALDGEFTDAVQRYRTLKQAQGPQPAAAPVAAATAPPAQG
jgi:hypothetical protein